jgi:redox-sensitive bicupin YhaK (pirin superfamily)
MDLVVIVPQMRDLGDGFQVHRALPSAQRRMVGPFVFWDQMGPTLLEPGKGLDVRPHPHIGLATVTYLFEGEILHRDSLGSVQSILPGAVNWMIAGRGIVHSERTPPHMRRQGGPLFGIQSWVALPKDQEECAPAFTHYGCDTLPMVEGDGLRMRVIAGILGGVRSPVRTASEMIYGDVALQAGARLPIPAEPEERAVYVVDGTVELAGRTCVGGELIILPAKTKPILRATQPSRLMIFGGASMDGPRHVWWNLVSSSRERIEQAKDDWRNGRFPPVPGETEFIPLPDEASVVNYP